MVGITMIVMAVVLISLKDVILNTDQPLVEQGVPQILATA
jgi:hypothetical protein